MRTRELTEEQKNAMRWHIQLYYQALWVTVHIEYMNEEIEADEKWAIDQINNESTLYDDLPR